MFLETEFCVIYAHTFKIYKMRLNQTLSFEFTITMNGPYLNVFNKFRLIKVYLSSINNVYLSSINNVPRLII